MTKAIHTITQILLAISAAVLAMMMFLTAADVVMRYIFKLPIAGAFELTEYMMAFIVPFAVAYCAEQKGHVAVDLFFKKLPKFIQKFLGYFISILTLLFSALITWQNILYIGETYKDHLTSSVLLIPTYPFIAPVALGIGIYTLIIAFNAFNSTSEAKIK